MYMGIYNIGLTKMRESDKNVTAHKPISSMHRDRIPLTSNNRETVFISRFRRTDGDVAVECADDARIR